MDINKKDNVKNCLISLLNLTGPIGSYISQVIHGYWTNKRISYIEDIVKAMSEKLSVNFNEDLKKYLTSEEYIHLFLNAIQKAQIEHQESKRKYYGNLLANCALDQKTEYYQKKFFISNLFELEEIHIIALSFLDKISSSADDENEWISFEKLNDYLFPQKEPSSYVTISVLNKLASSGFIKSAGNSNKVMMGTNPVGLWFHSKYLITDYGKRFLQFIKD